jgi:hypothetical protein
VAAILVWEMMQGAIAPVSPVLSRNVTDAMGVEGRSS